MDETKLNDLLFEIRKLVETFREAGRTGATGSTRDAEGQRITTAFDRSTERLVRALAQLGTSIKSESRGRTQREREIDDFVAAVDRATDAAEAQNQAAAERVRAEQEAAAAAQRRAAVEQEVAERATWTQKQRDEYDRRMTRAAAQLKFDTAQQQAKEDLYNIGRERNFAQELAEAKLREFRATFTMERALGATGDILSQKFGTNLVKTHIALAVLSGVVGSAASALSGLGKSVISLAASTATGFNNFNQFNQVVDTVANGLSKMGAAIPFFGAAMIAAAEGSKFLLGQLQRVSESFNSIAQVGGLTSDGMEGVFQQFRQSGLTLEAYTKQVTSNSQALARLGGSVGEGAEQFSRLTGSIIDSDIGPQLRAIGFSSEQIADTAAGFITQQARLGRAQRMTQEQLTAGTVRYARELDQISKLTGMQREELQKRMDAALSEQRFRAKINELENSGRGDVAKQLNMFQAAVGESAPELAQGLRDIIAAGGAVTTDASRKAFTLTGGEIVNIAQRALRGEDVGTSLQGLAQAVGRGTQNFNKIAQVADLDPIIGNFAQASDFASKGLNDFAKTLDRIRADQEKGMTAPTEMTRNVTQAQQAMDDMSRNINEFSMLALPAASEAVRLFSNTLNDGIRELGQMMGVDLPAIKERTAGEARNVRGGASAADTLKTAAAYTGTGVGAAGGAKAGMMVGSAFGPAGILAGGLIGAAVGAAAGYFGTRSVVGEPAPRPAGNPPVEVPGNQSVKGLPPGKNLNDVLAFTSPSGTQQAFMGLDNRLRERVIQAAVDYNQATGNRLQINSALRSRQDQERLYQESVAAGRPGKGPTGMPIARPGNSPHEKGIAVDIDNYRDPRALAALNQAGLYNRVAGDPVHFHMARGGIIRARPGGSTVTAGEAGQNEAFVPLPDGRNIPVAMDQRFQSQLADIISEMNSVNRVNFSDIARRSETSIRSLDGMISGMIPNITDLVEQVRDSDMTGAVNTMARAMPVDTQARQMIQDLGRSIETVARRQADLDLHHNNLLEQMVNLQSRTATASERLLRVRQS